MRSSPLRCAASSRRRSTSRSARRRWRSCAAIRSSRSPAARPRRSPSSWPPGVLLIAAALAAWRPGGGPGALRGAAVLAALAWPLREWAIPAAGAAFTAGLVLYAAWPALLAAAALRGPDERRLSRPAVLVLACAFTTSIGVLGRRLGRRSSTRAPRGACSARPTACSSPATPATWHDLGRAGLTLSAAWTAAFAALAVTRLDAPHPRAAGSPPPCSSRAVAAGAVRDRRAAWPRSRLCLQRPDRPRAVGRRDRRAGAGGGGRGVGADPHPARPVGARPARGRPGRLARGRWPARAARGDARRPVARARPRRRRRGWIDADGAAVDRVRGARSRGHAASSAATAASRPSCIAEACSTTRR